MQRDAPSLNGGNTIGDVIPGGPSCAIDELLAVIEQKRASAHRLAGALFNAESVASSGDIVDRKPSILIGRYRECETRKGARLTRKVTDFSTKIASHRFHKTRSQSRTFDGTAINTANTVIFHKELASTI